MLILERRSECAKIDDATARIVDETGTPLHPTKLALADHSPCGRVLRNVQGNDIALGEERLERCGGLDVSMAELIRWVVIDDAHSHRLGEHGKLAADIAVADDAEGLAT